MNGIYQYKDKQTNEVVYIGKDSHIDKKNRHYSHLAPSHYNSQPFNKILQNNPDRYIYEEIYIGDFSDDLLNVLEVNNIAESKPKFNFTDGGDGIYGHRHSKKTIDKIRNSNLNKKRSNETRKRISQAKKGKYVKNNNPSWKNYARITKAGFQNNKQQYRIRYNGKNLFRSIDKQTLINRFQQKYPNIKLYCEVSKEWIVK